MMSPSGTAITISRTVGLRRALTYSSGSSPPSLGSAAIAHGLTVGEIGCAVATTGDVV